jgi:hypothetical protein
MSKPLVASTETTNSCWPWSHRWSKWADKQWSKLLRSRLSLRTTTSTADEAPQTMTR